MPTLADELLHGGVDVHIHTNPHAHAKLHGIDVIELSRQALAAGMRALVVKDIGVPTTGSAYVVTRVGGGVPVYGAHVMNLTNGGISPRSVWMSLTHGDGARVVHFPTGDTLNHLDYRKKFYAGVNPPLNEDEAITVLDKDGKLIPEVREIVALVKEHDAWLATCHLSAKESHLVVNEAKAQGLDRIIISHSHWAMTRLTFEDLKHFVELGCLLEFEASLIMPIMHFVHGETPTDPRILVKSMKALGAENCFISSDLGQIYSPLPVEGMRSYIAMLVQCGMTPDEIRVMFHRNPARIARLD